MNYNKCDLYALMQLIEAYRTTETQPTDTFSYIGKDGFRFELSIPNNLQLSSINPELYSTFDIPEPLSPMELISSVLYVTDNETDEIKPHFENEVVEYLFSGKHIPPPSTDASPEKPDQCCEVNGIHLHGPYHGSNKSRLALLALSGYEPAQYLLSSLVNHDDLFSEKTPSEATHTMAALIIDRGKEGEKEEVKIAWQERHSHFIENTLALAKTTDQVIKTQLEQVVSSKFTGFYRFDGKMSQEAENLNKDQATLFTESLKKARDTLQKDLNPEDIANALQQLHDKPFTKERDEAFLSALMTFNQELFEKSISTLTHQQIVSLLAHELEITTRPYGNTTFSEQEKKILQFAKIIHESGYWFVNYQSSLVDHPDGYHGVIKEGQLDMCPHHTPTQDAKLQQSLALARQILALSQPQQTQLQQDQAAKEVTPPQGGVIQQASSPLPLEISEKPSSTHSPIYRSISKPVRRGQKGIRRITFPTLTLSIQKNNAKELFTEEKKKRKSEDREPILIRTKPNTGFVLGKTSNSPNFPNRVPLGSKSAELANIPTHTPRLTYIKCTTAIARAEIPSGINLTTNPKLASEVFSAGIELSTTTTLSKNLKKRGIAVKLVENDGLSTLTGFTTDEGGEPTGTVYVNQLVRKLTKRVADNAPQKVSEQIQEIRHSAQVVKPNVHRLLSQVIWEIRPAIAGSERKDTIAAISTASTEKRKKTTKTITVNARITPRTPDIALKARKRVTGKVVGTKQTAGQALLSFPLRRSHTVSRGETGPKPSPTPRKFNTTIEFRAPLTAPAKEEVSLGSVLANLEVNEQHEEAEVVIGSSQERTTKTKVSENKNGTSHGVTTQEISGDHKVTVVKTQMGEERFAVENSQKDVATARSQKRILIEEATSTEAQEAGTDERSEGGQQQAANVSPSSKTFITNRSRAVQAWVKQTAHGTSMSIALPTSQFLPTDPYLAKSEFLRLLIT